MSRIKPLTDEEFEKLELNDEIKILKEVIATVREEKSLACAENAKLKERLSVKQKINEDQNDYISRLDAELEGLKHDINNGRIYDN